MTIKLDPDRPFKIIDIKLTDTLFAIPYQPVRKEGSVISSMGARNNG
jgi:hypothetical protein